LISDKQGRRPKVDGIGVCAFCDGLRAAVFDSGRAIHIAIGSGLSIRVATVCRGLVSHWANLAISIPGPV